MAEPSFWFREVPDAKRFPSLEGNLRVDAAVIGGGIAGISAAYFLSRAGVKTSLLEMGGVVTGDSGYTTAFATHYLDSVEATIRAWQASEAGIALLKDTISQEKIDCDWKESDGVAFTRKPDASAFLEDYRVFRQVAPSLEFFEGDAASGVVGFPVSAAVRAPGTEGQFHVRKLLVPLAERAAKQGAAIFEGSEVIALERSDAFTLKTEKGSLTADWLIVASGPPQQFFPEIASRLSGAVTYVLHASYESPPPFGRSLFWDDLEPYHYFRWVGERDLIIGGEDWVMKEPRPAANPHTALEAWLREVSGGASFFVANRWQGTIFYTPDVLPFIGSHPASGDRVVFLTGWAGNGMAHGFLSGAIAAGAIQGKPHPYAALFSPARSVSQ